MYPISSPLESTKLEFALVRNKLEEHRFALGGSWDYHQGSFDRYLDEGHKAWLRIPFQVINGTIDVETDDNDAKIQLGKPFVLKHLYREGNDPEASVRIVGALFDQFQTPVDPDADIEPHYIEEAKQVLHQVEQMFLS
ncbi:YugN family protein [Paenibacillus sp. GCM10023252]|uniref:YugN family protein n=1 Tax=Paenibacillus sp. GCM10023252 TaxID=3252649 RepID=UPI00361249D5